MEGSRILVAGGAGYVGSHAAKALHRAGYLPVVVDNLVTGHRAAVRWGPFVHADIGDPAALEAAFAQFRPAAVLHFAAYAYVGESVAHPRRYYRNNVANTLTLLDACLRHGCVPLVFSSSCATYGVPERLPIDETHPQQPINPYGQSKLMVEQVLRSYHRAYGLRSVSLRYFNAAGADPEGDLGEDHDPETHLIPLAIRAALGSGPPLEVYGTAYPTTDGTAVRDFVHVSDLADAHVRALRHLLEGGAPLALNLGLGRGYSVREVIASVERVAGRNVPSREGTAREGDPAELVADARRARESLGWTPVFRGLDDIVASAWPWFARPGAPTRQRGDQPGAVRRVEQEHDRASAPEGATARTESARHAGPGAAPAGSGHAR